MKRKFANRMPAFFLALLLGSLSCGRAWARSPWPQFHRGRQHTSLSNVTGSRTGTLSWTYTASNQIRSSPVIGSDGSIYFGTWPDGNVHTLNSTGSLAWTYATGDPIYSSPALNTSAEVVYIGSDDNRLYALNATGDLKWSYTTGDDLSNPITVGPGERVYTGSYDNRLYAFNSTGMYTWARSITISTPSIPAARSHGRIAQAKCSMQTSPPRP